MGIELLTHPSVTFLDEAPLLLVTVNPLRYGVQLLQVLDAVVDGPRVDVPWPPRVGVGRVVLGDELLEVAPFKQRISYCWAYCEFVFIPDNLTQLRSAS